MIKSATHHMSKIAAVAVVAASAAISRWRTNQYIADYHASAANSPVGVDMSISNTAFPSSVSTGDSIVFMYYYQNESGIPTSNITMTTTIPNGFSFSSSNNSNYTINGDTITWTNLADGYGLVLLELHVDNDASGLITDTVQITSSADDPYINNNTYVAVVNIEGTTTNTSTDSADISITKNTESTSASLGQNINYTLTVANTNGPDTAHDVAVVDTLPDGLTFVSAVPSPDYQSGHTLAWNVDTLEYGQTKQIQMVTSVSTLLHIGDALMNFATVSTTDNDPIINNNVDFVVTQVGDGKSADLGILSMQVIDSEVHTNETTSINMEIENAGPDTAKNAVLEFNIPSGVTIQSVSPTPTSTTATKLTRNLGNLGTVYFPVSIGLKATTLGSKNFTATIGSDTPDFDPADDTKNVSLNIIDGNTTGGGSSDGGGSSGGGNGSNGGGGNSIPQPVHNSPTTTSTTSTGLTQHDQDLLDLFSQTFDNIAKSFAARSCVDDTNLLYKYAKEHDLTSAANSTMFRLCDPITRIELAKIITQYAINIAGMTPDYTRVCEYTDLASTSTEEQYFAKTSCQLGLMGLEYNGVPAHIFDPYAHVSRAMVSTILSRLLFGTEYNGNAACWYCDHMQALKNSGILKMIGDPMDDLLRGYAVLMLMRADVNGVVKTSIEIRNKSH